MNIKQLLRRELLKESEGERYMFFSNLEQMRRQCDLLLDLDHNQVEEILKNGHDWAQDHIAEAKNNMDQVFDFLMNETKSTHKMQDEVRYPTEPETMMEGKRKQVLNYVLVVNRRLSQNSKFILQHMPMVMPYKYVKEGCQG